VSWDDDEPFSIDLSGKRPWFRILAEAHKGRRDQLLPMTPDFAAFVLQTPQPQRQGRLFKLPMGVNGKPLRPEKVGAIASCIGERAGVIVNKAKGKFASAHDLRRSFGSRWAPRVKPLVLQKLMRHTAIKTTLKYYVELDADEVAEELWRSHGPVPTSPNTPCPGTSKEALVDEQTRCGATG
jgi:integrase